ncbi:MAG: hypothetical protein ACI81O_000740 [Cyclobacteriaceae bacterium]|jgi:hypothetical protein
MQALCLSICSITVVQAQDNLPTSSDWLTISFEQQSRMQFLDGQFRAGLEGSDQALELRHLLKTDVKFDRFSLTVEMADMRTYFSDSSTPLDSTTTNPLDILQAHVTLPFAGLLSDDDEGFIKIGRFSMDQGNRRWVSRNLFRNTINSFSGVHAKMNNSDANYELFYTLPTNRRTDGDPLDNKPRLDNEPGDTRFWGAFFETRLPGRSDFFETYLYGLEENRQELDKRRRFDILSTGIRMYRSPALSQWHYEAEGLIQFGDAPAIDQFSPQRDHRALFFHLTAGYTFNVAWQPQLNFIYDYASGDKNPLDNESNSFDSLYGVPRAEYGPTGIYRAFVRNNIKAPGLLLNLQPASNIDAFIKLQDYSLAAEEQGWRTTRYQHPGNLGEDHVGTQLETRARWHLRQRSLTLETGYTWLKAGNYMDLVNKGDTHYFYVQTIVRL